MDTLTYRISGHSPSDASSYRTKEEIDAWNSQDSIIAFGVKLVEGQITDQGTLNDIRLIIVERTEKILKMAGDMDISPRLDLVSDPNAIGHYMFSNDSIEKFDDRKPEVKHNWDENPRVQQIKKKERFGYKDGKPVPKIKAYNFRDGVFEAIFDRYYKDPTLVAFGEENRDWGGAFAVYRGLTEALPYNRLFNTSISEGAIAGVATGYGMCGGRAIPELMYCDFLGRAGDEIFNQLSKWQAMSGGYLKMPVVLRVSVGSKYGAQHSQDWTSIVSHIPGLKVVFPATPYDAKGLMNAALQGSDPVVFFESQRIYDIPELFHEEGVPEGYYEIEIGEPDIKKPGNDITILSIGATLYKVTEAADELEKNYGISAEIIDARSLVPFNYDLVIESIKKTGRILLVSDACERGSILKDMSANVTELAFDYLDAPPVVVGSRNWITPPYEMEEYFFPQVSWILDAIHQKILPLEGHRTFNDFSNRERLERAKKGV
jgi:2-oxoisovalerate dehydrogenase E1 component